jgi:protein tyrosine phosphatase
VERSVVTSDFRETMSARELDAEFRLLRKLTETKEHIANQETLDKKASGKLNRYAELRPFKHTRVRLLQRNEDIHDSYINANYINSSIATNDQLFIATQGPLPHTSENFWRMVD